MRLRGSSVIVQKMFQLRVAIADSFQCSTIAVRRMFFSNMYISHFITMKRGANYLFCCGVNVSRLRLVVYCINNYVYLHFAKDTKMKITYWQNVETHNCLKRKSVNKESETRQFYSAAKLIICYSASI